MKTPTQLLSPKCPSPPLLYFLSSCSSFSGPFSKAYSIQPGSGSSEILGRKLLCWISLYLVPADPKGRLPMCVVCVCLYVCVFIPQIFTQEGPHQVLREQQ